MTSILSLLGIDEKETELLAVKAELVIALQKNVQLSNTVIALLEQRNALQEKLKKRGLL